MGKRIFLFILLLTLTATSASAATTYDIAYYLGMVTANGGSTLTDGYWVLNNERGSEEDLTSIYDENPENALLIHSSGNYVMLTNFWHDGGTTWITNNTRVFAVGADYIEYCALYSHTENFAVLPAKRPRWSRNMEVGQTETVSTTAQFTATNTTIDFILNFTLVADGVTIPAAKLPSGSGDLANCITVAITTLSPLSSEHMIQVYGPGKGPLLSREFDYSASDSGAPMGGMDVYVHSQVPAWGNGSPYYSGAEGQFVDAAEISRIEGIVNGLSIPTDHVEGGSGATKVVVVPLN